MRHAVVPNEIRCHHGNSVGIAVRIPEQQRSQPSSTETRGSVFAYRMVVGNLRDRSIPAQKGQR
jgi:hypothetical protein